MESTGFFYNWHQEVLWTQRHMHKNYPAPELKVNVVCIELNYGTLRSAFSTFFILSYTSFGLFIFEILFRCVTKL